MLDYFGFHSNYENNKLINEIKCQIKKDKKKRKTMIKEIQYLKLYAH